MDKIVIENLTVFAKHGVLEEEHRLGQKFLFSVVIETDLRTAGITDDIENTMNYAEICEKITRFNEENPCFLIEAAAERTADMILKEYSGAQRVTIKLKKPWAPIGLPLDSAGVTISRSWHSAYIALGSNMGDKRAYLEQAVKSIADDENCRVEKVSDFIITEPVGGVEQEDFLNGCMKIKTLYSPHELLIRLQNEEKAAKRERKIHWGPRTLDLDIILYDDLIIDDDDLKIPHIEMHNRAFVLKPLVQIAPYAKNPANGLCAIHMLEKISPKSTKIV